MVGKEEVEREREENLHRVAVEVREEEEEEEILRHVVVKALCISSRRDQ